MSFWLRSVPHRIPFRAASEIRVDEDTVAHGLFLPSASDALPGVSLELMLVEAMAQIGGALAFRESSAPGMLTALDEVKIEEVPQPGDRIEIEVRLDVTFAGLHRLHGTASLDGREIASARFVLGEGGLAE